MAKESWWDKFMRFIGFEAADDDGAFDEEEPEAYAPPARGRDRGISGRASETAYEDRARTGVSGRVVSMPNQSASSMKMILFQPMSYSDTETIIDNVRANKPVVINMESLDVEVSQRVLDYVSGAAYALGGSIRRVSKGIFVVVPGNVDVSGNMPDEMRGRSSFGLTASRFDE